MSLLAVEALDVRYGRTRAVQSVSLALEPGEIVTVLGSNGAGKSSLLRAIQGTVPPAGGRVVYRGEDITRWSAPRRVAHGLVLVPEGRQIFVSLTVQENLLLGAYTRREDVGREIERIYERFPNLGQRREMPAAVLSGGEQQMLAIGRALMAAPRLILADEMSQGLAPVIVQDVYRRLLDVNRRGVTILLVEQNARLAFKLAQFVYVMEEGRVALAGPSADVAASEHVQRAYLGVA
jgi:branched-chain amino acid transport system ATP-binding protein